MNKKNEEKHQKSQICPYFMVDDVKRQMDFILQVFEAKEIERVIDEAGEIMHGEIAISNAKIMLGKSRPEWPSRQSTLYVYVRNSAKTHETALQAGAKEIMGPGKRDYGVIESGFEDLQGNHWWIAEKMN